MSERCEACRQEKSIDELIEAPLGYYMCSDPQECIAQFSGWTEKIGSEEDEQ